MGKLKGVMICAMIKAGVRVKTRQGQRRMGRQGKWEREGKGKEECDGKGRGMDWIEIQGEQRLSLSANKGLVE